MELKWLLLFIPIAMGLSWFEANPIIVFIASALAIIPLANLLGDATEVLARSLGSTKVAYLILPWALFQISLLVFCVTTWPN